MKPTTVLAVQSELGLQRSPSGCRRGRRRRCRPRWDHRDPCPGMPRATMSLRRPSQMVKHMAAIAQRMGLEPPRQAVAQAAFGGGAVVDGGVFPEGPHFIDDWECPAARPTRSAGIALSTGECACRMCGPHLAAPLRAGASGSPSSAPPPPGRAASCPVSGRRAVEVPAVHRLVFGRRRRGVLRAGQVEGLPAQLALLAQQGQRAEGVAAVQRDRVIQDVKDSQQSSWRLEPLRQAARWRAQPARGRRWSHRPPCAGRPRTSAASTAGRCGRWAPDSGESFTSCSR